MSRRRKTQVTVGYWYGLSMHMALCHGPVDAITEVLVGERTAWTGNQESSGDIAISRRDLFGGDEREGGPDGTLTVMMGHATQAPNAYLQGRLGATNVPAYRGVLSVLWNGWAAAMNPYIKPWSFRVKRIPKSWYPDKAEIDGDANPAHIIRECLTNREWGMGYPEADIDDASFTAAADALYDEAFGLSLLWQTEQKIEDFLLDVLQHIDGSLYVHPRTGKFVLRLARADYDPNALLILNPDNVLGIEEFSRRGHGEAVNQITVQYRDGPADRDASVTVQDIASIEMQGGVIAQTLGYPGISNAALANRVAARELRQLSSSLAKLRLVATRVAGALNVGDVFRFAWPPYGIENAIFRVARISYGELADGRVRIEAIEDVFGAASAVYADPPSTGWSDPLSPPAPCPAQAIYEAPYREIVEDLTGDAPSILGDIDPVEGVVATLGRRPSLDAIDYRAVAWDAARSEWVTRGRGAFAPTALLVGAMPQAVSDITVAVAGGVDLDAVSPLDDYAIIDDEWFHVVGIDLAASAITLTRGALDTVPTAHSAGARVWIARPLYVLPEYVVGETAQVRLLPKTSRGELAVSGAATLSTDIARRFIRPLPPGDVRLNGAHHPVAVAGNITITWAHRNRIHQTTGIVRQTDGNITPETGQTVTLRIYGGATLDALRRTYTDLDGNNQIWTLANAASDGAGNDGRIRVEVESSRTDANGTFTSLYRHDITTDRAGYGLRWGEYYGGV